MTRIFKLGFVFPSEKAQAESYLRLQVMHSVSLLVWGVFAIAIIIYSCYWSLVAGKGAAYTDPSTQWQACLTASQSVKIPLNTTVQAVVDGVNTFGTNLTNTITDLVPLTCSARCALAIKSSIDAGAESGIPAVPNIEVPNGQIITSLSYLGLQSIIYSFAGLVVLNKSFRNPSWLPVSIVLLSWIAWNILMFYTINPILPVPNQINSTLAMVIKLALAKFKFDNVNKGNNLCNDAYTYIWIYLGLIIVLFVIVLFNLVLAVLGEMIKLQDANRPHYEHLAYTEYAAVISAISAAFYVLLGIGKTYSSSVALQSIGEYDKDISETYGLWFEQIWFPFLCPNLDLGTILYILSFMSVVRGYTIQSVTGFQIGAAASIVYCIQGYPALIGPLEFLRYSNFMDWDTCWQYFQGIFIFYLYLSIPI